MDEKTLPTHPFTGLTAIGWTTRGPVWPVAGGSQPVGDEDDEQGDEGDDAGTDEGDDGGETPDEEPGTDIDWKSMYDEQAAALEATQAKLQRARAQAKNLRLAAQSAGTPAAPAAPVAPRRQQPRNEPEPQVVTVPDTAEVERWQTRAVLADARAQLLSRGCDPELIDAPLSRLKVGEIDWDGDEPMLDEYLDEMEERYPKLFMRLFEQPVQQPVRAAPRRAPSIDQAAGNGSTGRAPQQQKSFGQVLWESGQGDIRAPRRRA